MFHSIPSSKAKYRKCLKFYINIKRKTRKATVCFLTFTKVIIFKKNRNMKMTDGISQSNSVFEY